MILHYYCLTALDAFFSEDKWFFSKENGLFQKKLTFSKEKWAWHVPGRATPTS